MSPGSSTRAVLLCFLVGTIYVCGSPRGFTVEESARHRRHASCPTCGKDCPGTLSSPWYGRQVFEGSPTREYRVLGREIYPRWSRGHMYPRERQVPTYPFIPQYRRNVPTSHSENPFAIRGSRSIDPYVPASPATPAFRMQQRPPTIGRHRESDEPWALKLHDRREIDHGKYARTWSPSEPRGDLIEPRKAYFPVQRDDRPNESGEDVRKDFGEGRRAEDQTLRGGDGAEGAGRSDFFDASAASQGRSRAFWGNGRGFTLQGQLPQRSEHGSRFSFAKPDMVRQDAPRKLHQDLMLHKGYRDDRDRAAGSRDPRAFRASNVPMVPRVKYNPYNLPADLNVLKMIKNMEDQATLFRNQTPRVEGDSESRLAENPAEDEKVSSEEETEEEESAEEVKGGDKEDEGLSADFATAQTKDSKEENGDSVASETNGETTSESEKLTVQSEEEGSEEDDEAFSDRDLDLFEDIENPPADPTEPTTVDSFTESSTLPE